MIGIADFQISTLLSSASSRQDFSRPEHGAKVSRSGRQQMNPQLEQLCAGLEVFGKKIRSNPSITCLITDSRRVVPGALFFAIGGLRKDGNHYVEEAVDRGAVAIVTEQDLGSHFPIEYLQVKDVRKSLALISRRFYASPDDKLKITGITGTNGKTTVAMLAQHLLGGQDKIGLLGTIRYDLGRRTLPSFKTTPESVDVYSLLGQMVDNNCEEAVIEVSSHGIDQQRIFGLNINLSVFLNLTQDHIDYHKSMEEYYQVKKRLFTGEMGPLPEIGVINLDCHYGQRLRRELTNGLPLVTFGMWSDALIHAQNVKLFADRTEFDLCWPDGEVSVVSPLLGRYNVSNLLAALAICHAKGYPIRELLRRINSFPSVPGRMQSIKMNQPFNVLVDYAHTDDALRLATEMLTEITYGRLIVVFGCGGDRDRSKRAPMLRAAIAGADEVWVTSDNPRSEPVQQIFDDMDARASSQLHFIDERRRAISLALDSACPGDCVLIAGKGHESYQEFDGTVIPFDDRQITRELLKLKGYCD